MDGDFVFAVCCGGAVAVMLIVMIAVGVKYVD